VKQCTDCEHRSFGMCLRHDMAIRNMSSCGVSRAPKYLTLEDFMYDT